MEPTEPWDSESFRVKVEENKRNRANSAESEASRKHEPMTTTKEPTAAGNYNLDFANERGAEEAGREVDLIGPSFPLWPQARADISNEKSPRQKTIELIFAPAAAAIEIITDDSFANAGYNPDEPRMPAGQPGGGRWTSGDPGGTERQAQRTAQAKKLALLAQRCLEKAAEEDLGRGPQPWADREYQRHYAAAEEARQVAEEMQRRAYILEHGKEDDYRPLMLKQYGINNPELNHIAAYYAEKFNDQATLNWLKLQHPYIRSQKDDLDFVDSMAMMLLGGVLEEFEGGMSGDAGSITAKSPFDQASDAEERSAYDEKAMGPPATQIPTINGRRPINSKYAGKMHPAGVEFTLQGFPDFSDHALAEVEVDGLTGNKGIDSKLANKAVGLQKTPKGYVWHHVEDGETMQLVPIDIHDEVKHTGGAAIIRNGGFDK